MGSIAKTIGVVGPMCYFEAEIPLPWREMLFASASRFACREKDGSFSLRARGLPNSLPSNLDPNFFERMVWALMSHSGIPVVFQPLFSTLRGNLPMHLMKCELEVLGGVWNKGCLALARRCEDYESEESVADVMRMSGFHAGWSFSRCLLEETECLEVAETTDERRLRWRASVSEWAKNHDDFPWVRSIRNIVDGLAQAAQGLRRVLLPVHGKEVELARQRMWQPAFSRIEAQIPPPDGRVHIWMAMHWIELGGAEGFAIDLIRRLPKGRYAVHVTTDTFAKNTWATRLAGYVEEIIELPSFLEGCSLDSFFDYFVVSRGIRMVHIHHSGAAYSALFGLKRFHPELVVLDTLHILEMSRHRGGMPELSARNCEPFIDCHHVSTHYLKRFLRERWHVPDKKIRVIHTNPDLQKFDPDRIPCGAYRASIGIPGDALLVSFVGRFHIQKRPFDFVKMAQALHERWTKVDCRPLYFVMDGSGVMESKLRNAVRRAGLEKMILFPGATKDIPSLLRDTDIVVLPSENEGIALVAFEAMAMGVPIVCTRVQGQEELVPTELLVEPDGNVVSSLVERVYSLLVDEEQRMRIGRELRQIIASRKSCEESFCELTALYDDLLHQPSKS